MGKARRHILLTLFKFFDLAILVGSFIGSTLTSLRGMGAISFTEFLAIRISVRNFAVFTGLLLLWHLLFAFFGLYDSKRLSRHLAEAIDVLKATSLGTFVLIAVSLLLHLTFAIPLFFASFWLFSTASVVVSRLSLRVLLEQVRLRGRNQRYVLIVGTNPRAVQFARSIEANPALGYRVLGFVDRNWPGMKEFRKTGYRLSCDPDGFQEFLRKNVIDEVLIAWPMRSLYQDSWRLGAFCEEQGLITRYFSNLFDMKLSQSGIDEFAGNAVITMAPRLPNLWVQIVKRTLDFTLSLTAIIVLLPFFFLITILIKLTSPGPVIFKQKRVGLNKRIFSLYKFRTMVVGAEQKQAELEHLNEASGPVFKIKNDPRISPIGKFLRRSSIDELPQLFNVLKGDMSLVGPRPLPVRDYEGFRVDWQRRRFCVRPGITCLWQVMGRSSLSFERWMQLDIEYVDRCSLWLDVQILLQTIPAVFRGSGAA
jgi:exopolysaccharide biosynthesis polyprenyl glycosylphosphotransferase